MASLREIKDHIGSVRSTLKITGAMKLVASAKLRKAQQAVECMRPYTEAVSRILEDVKEQLPGAPAVLEKAASSGKVAVVAVASNSSLCGAFNVNVVRRLQETLDSLKRDGDPPIEIFAVGRKAAEAVRKLGFPVPDDYSGLVGHASFEQSSALAGTLIDGYGSGRFSRVILIYNHFVSTSSQKVCVETYLPFTPGTVQAPASSGSPDGGQDYIIEPSPGEVLATLLPQVMRLRIHTVILDSVAAEHAARTIAMQTATDNAEDLLDELTLEYNKGRQQKITSEILDLVGGAGQ